MGLEIVLGAGTRRSVIVFLPGILSYLMKLVR